VRRRRAGSHRGVQPGHRRLHLRRVPIACGSRDVWTSTAWRSGSIPP
jgi:hypothetical protein